jgi:hypothetical protein
MKGSARLDDQPEVAGEVNLAIIKQSHPSQYRENRHSASAPIFSGGQSS